MTCWVRHSRRPCSRTLFPGCSETRGLLPQRPVRRAILRLTCKSLYSCCKITAFYLNSQTINKKDAQREGAHLFYRLKRNLFNHDFTATDNVQTLRGLSNTLTIQVVGSSIKDEQPSSLTGGFQIYRNPLHCPLHIPFHSK